MTHKIKDLNRRNLSFANSKIREVLPEYFVDTYPNIITFLEKYYEYLEGDYVDSFKEDIVDLLVSRDIQQADLDKVDLLFSEIASDINSGSFFGDPRIMGTLLAKFYRVKGSRNSIEGFFRGFYGEEVEVEYPKKQMFIVGESQIGYESLKFIQNNALYQIFSILIKSPIALSDYGDLYKRLVHPAGFYFASLLQIVSLGNSVPVPQEAPSPLDSGEALLIAGTASISYDIPTTEMIALIDENGVLYRARLSSPDILNDYDDASSDILALNGAYRSIAEWMSPNSFKFDDSADSIGPDFSLNFETMDNNHYSSYSDSANSFTF